MSSGGGQGDVRGGMRYEEEESEGEGSESEGSESEDGPHRAPSGYVHSATLIHEYSLDEYAAPLEKTRKYRSSFAVFICCFSCVLVPSFLSLPPFPSLCSQFL